MYGNDFSQGIPKFPSSFTGIIKGKVIYEPCLFFVYSGIEPAQRNAQIQIIWFICRY